MDQKKFDNLKPGDLVGFKHKTEALGLVVQSRLMGSKLLCGSYQEVTIKWCDEDGWFKASYASDDNPSLEQLRIIVKAKK